MSKTYLSMSTVGVEDSAFIVDSRCRRPTFRCQQSVSSPMLQLYLILCTTHLQKHPQNTTLQIITIHFYIHSLLLYIQTLVFQHWSERQIKAELSSASPNLSPSNASYLQGETIKSSFCLSPSRIDITGCADRTLSSWHPAVQKKHTHTHTYN